MADHLVEEWHPQGMPTAVIVQLGRSVTRACDEALRKTGITVSQLPVLVALKNGGRLTQAELARIARVEQPSMAQLLARMEREGLVRREPSPSDRRSSLIVLTQAAIERLKPGRDALRSVNTVACRGLSADERTLLLGLLSRMAANIGEASCAHDGPIKRRAETGLSDE